MDNQGRKEGEIISIRLQGQPTHDPPGSTEIKGKTQPNQAGASKINLDHSGTKGGRNRITWDSRQGEKHPIGLYY